MNKFAKVMCMMAVVALTFTACKKKEEASNAFVFHGDTEQFMVVNEDGGFERVSIDANNRPTFDEGDQIMIFNLMKNVVGSACVSYTVQSDGTWLPDGVMGTETTDGNFYAFYPAQSVKVPSINFNESSRVTFNLQPTQYYAVDNSGNPRIPDQSLYAAAKDETHKNLNDTWFSFKNICGIMALNLYSPMNRTVTKIEVTDNSFNLVGDVTLKIDKVDPTYMTTLFRNYSDDAAYQAALAEYLDADHLGYSTAPTSKTITLDCGSGVLLGRTPATAKRFLIVMRPLALLNGCNVRVYFNDETYNDFPSTKNNMISPNVIRNFNPINVR